MTQEQPQQAQQPPEQKPVLKPPPSWYAAMYARAKAHSPHMRRNTLERSVIGTWLRYPNNIKQRLVDRYDGVSPSLGQVDLPCPRCLQLNPVLHNKLFVRCSRCGVQLMKVKLLK